MTLTAAGTVKLLKEAISEYNYWGESESDSPLNVKRSRIPIDDKKILSLDESVRRKLSGAPKYEPPARTVRKESLQKVFQPLVNNIVNEIGQKRSDIEKGAGLETLEMSAEALEFYVKLYMAFSQLLNPYVCYIDADNDPYVGLFILGQSSEGETIYAQSLLTQT